MKGLKLKVLDKIVIIIVLIFSVLPTGLLILAKPSNVHSNIVIRVDDKIVKEIPLIKKSKSSTYEFSFNNNKGYIEVKDGKVRMLVMDRKICPNAICSDTGWIDKSYQSIVCLPNKIIVTIEGNNNEGVDSLSS
jgi:hypothetical protein